jgi:acyl-CoA synthetase (AMP-forming)/AMP-acid ligase II
VTGILRRGALALSRDLTLGLLLERLARVHGDRRLVTEHGSGLVLSYREAAAWVARMAGGVAARIEPGDRVVVAAPNGYTFFLLCLAVSRAGGIPVPVNPLMTRREIAHVRADSGATWALRGADDVEGAEPLERAVPVRPDAVAAVFYTSGTTGVPKGAELTHRGLLAGVALGALWPAGLRRDEVVTALPVAHIAGFTVCVQAAAIGVPLYLLARFHPVEVLDVIESRRASAFVGVPAMYRMMLEAGADRRDLRSVRVWVSGADAMPDDLRRAFKRLGGAATLPLVHATVGEATFIDGYGMVEASGGVAVRVSPPHADLPLVPLPGYRLKVVDAQGAEVKVGEVGELVVKGPGVARGYHGDDAATRAAFTPDGWLRTGDLARRGPFGTVALAGRAKHVIKHGGYSVHALEVEHALEEHPDVVEAAVVGLPDPRKGEVPVAAVRLREGATTSEEDLLAWASERLAEYKRPQQVRIVPSLPRTGTHKVQRERLLALFG